MRTIRRVAGALLLLACASGIKAAAGHDAEWLAYQRLFIGPQGMVVDTANGGISHSEGQGIGLLLAGHYRDRDTFERIWRWTRSNLQVRSDRLLAWKWAPGESTGQVTRAPGDSAGPATGGPGETAGRGTGAPGASTGRVMTGGPGESPGRGAGTPGESTGRVTDTNNATDGDLLVAWALYRGARLWGEPQYLRAAREIGRDIRLKMALKSDHGLVLLPGEYGFVNAEGVTINLSYWVFPALQDMRRLDPAPEWEGLIENGLHLLRNGRFGRWQLPPDWLRLAAKPQPAPEFEPRFGYDAVRIPLYLIWAKLDNADNLKAFNDFWGQFAGTGLVPAWTALSDDSVASHGASTGNYAIMNLVRLRAAAGGRTRVPTLPTLDPGQDYYSASLLLLTKMAALESRAR